MTTNEKALMLHEKWNGKLETISKTPVKSREDLSLAYTPGVAEPCKVIAQDKEAAYKYTMKANTVAVVSDGSAVLGLGNIGPYAAMPVMEGKAVLFKEFGGVNAVPICLDNQDTEEIIKAVTYLAPGFGGINLEDISAPRCFEIEERLKEILDIPVFHDDQHGTAIVVLAGIINALKVVGKKKENCKVVINGAGSAGVAITKLLLTYGFPNIVMCDKVGIVSKATEGLNWTVARNKPKMHGNGLMHKAWLWQQRMGAMPHNRIVDSARAKGVAPHNARKHTSRRAQNRDIRAKEPQRILRACRVIAAACAKKHGRHKELIGTQQATNARPTSATNARVQAAQGARDVAS